MADDDWIERDLREGCKKLLQIPYSRRGPFRINDDELRHFIGNESAPRPKWSVIDEIAAERQRQRQSEGWTLAHDDAHTQGEMALAAAAYAVSSTMPPSEVEAHRDGLFGLPRGMFSILCWLWPWGHRWFKPRGDRRDLIRAGGLIVAEIERWDRLEASAAGSKQGNLAHSKGMEA